jgi:two-component system, NarL family, response regulator DevR
MTLVGAVTLWETAGVTGTSAIPVALVDDHELVGVALEVALSGSEKLAYAGRAATVSEYCSAGWDAAIVVLDLRLADGSSPVQNAEELIADGASVVAYTSAESPYLIRLAAQAPISGLVRKSSSLADLVDALERCALGELSFSTDWAAAIASDSGLERAGLSPREQEVLGLMASGMPAKVVATKLGIAIPTVEVHLRRLRDKYARAGRPAESRSELVMRALEDGHLPLPGDAG